MKKNIVLLSLLILGINNVKAQKRDYNTINIKSPESYHIEKINNVPVNKYIGAIDYSFPLFSIENTTNTYQFNLNYDSSGFKPGKKEGLFGLNWNSNIFGAITREVIGVPDDDAYKNANSDKLDGILGLIKQNYSKSDEDHFNLNYPQEKYTLNKLEYTRKDVILYDSRFHEMKSDKYYFNFLNISGYFYLSVDGSPIIVSETPGLSVDISNYTIQNPIEQIDCIPSYSEFIITDGNGVKYFFGGDKEAVEISIDHGNSGVIEAGHKRQFSQNITAWHITKVIFPNNDKIEYNYGEFFNYNQCIENNRLPLPKFINSSDFIFEINKFINQTNKVSDIKFSGTQGPYGIKGGEYSYYYTAPYYQFGITKKVKLDNIKFNNGNVKFNYKIEQDSNGYNSYKIESIVKSNHLNDTISNIKFYTLKDGVPNKKLGKDTRTFLSKIIKDDLTYKFEYYLNKEYPPFETVNVDYWGFWNGKFGEENKIIPDYEFNYLTGDIFITSDTRKENPSFSNVGNLKKVFYPTGGYQEFVYEPHTFSKKLERSSSSNFFPTLKNNIGETSGTRISTIKTFNSSLDTKPLEVITYKYDNLGSSSGIFTSMYDFIDYIDRVVLVQAPNVDVVKKEKLFIEHGVNHENKLFNSSNIGYSNVQIFKNDILQSEYKLTDYVKYPDLSPLNNPEYNKVVNNKDPNIMSYKPANYFFNKKTEYTDQSYKRGKVELEIHYENGRNIIEKNEFFYNEINEGNYCSNKSKNFEYSFICKDLKKNYTTYVNYMEKGMAQFIKNTSFPFVLEKEVKTSFLPGGNIISSKEYKYKSKILNLLSEESSSNSKNEKITTEYLYSSDLIGKEPYTKELTELNRVLEPVITKQKVGDLYISETHNQYNLFQNIIQKSATHQKKGAEINIGTSTDRKITYDFYDNKGNILQYTLENSMPVTVVWDYTGQYPVAKIEGISLSEFQETSYFISILENGNLSEEDEKYLRDYYPNAMITTYQYKPLVGLTKIMQPNGQTEYYKYDATNRLEEIRNDKKEVIKTFKYNYKKP
ncbi:hypothetical protein [Empedobacter brevis]|uniref:hypothetical protein n=1 Tax=Empedobacter brevis TaxID=247 RepID=UPI0023F0F595|nr:hypothetical protein [Empedobacter brevis]